MGNIPLTKASEATLETAAEALRQGKLVVFPTETVYGLGADATNEHAVRKIFAAKGRPAHNPLISHVSDLETLEKIAVASNTVRLLAKAFWPGPLTLVLPKSPDGPVGPLATAGLDTIAVRMPAHPTALSLLRKFGGPVVAPSANVSGQVSPTRAEHVQLTDETYVSMILDAGPCEVGLESTIINLVEDVPMLLRPGGITKEQIEDVIGPVREGPATSDTPSAPGQLASHYAPHSHVRLNADAPAPGEAYLGFGQACPSEAEHALNLSPTGDLAEAAANLYDYLRKLDGLGCDVIAVAPIPNTGLGKAINDRLTRAAAPRPKEG